MSQWIEGRIVGKKRWTDRLYSLQIDADLPAFKAGQFTRFALDIEGDRVGRPYSLVNAPYERPLEIYFNEVPEGPLTPRLSELAVGDRIWVAAKPGGVFTLDHVADRRHLWMLATGTALGVYLSILKTAEPWQRFERLILVHGARQREELTYGETIAEFQQRYPGQFTFIPVLSREQHPGVAHGRLTHLLVSGELEERARVSIDPLSSHFMLCGNAEMISDVKAWLESRGMHRHRKGEPGHYTTEQYH